ncbi:MAG: VanZ family protein [Opitutaceae bacterium]|nr:VanZ family protein [Cytophagales bacterium]
MIAFEKTPFYLRLILPVLWYGFIFFLTELPLASGNRTRDAISDVVYKNAPADIDLFVIIERINFVFRSSAHFFMFGIQSILIYFLFKPDFNFNKTIYLLVAFVAIGILGGLDEFHQSFVPGRVPRIIDVCIDISGAFFLLYSALWLKYRYIQASS